MRKTVEKRIIIMSTRCDKSMKAINIAKMKISRQSDSGERESTVEDGTQTLT